MFNVFSKILIIFLVWLQFFAPLLHTHTGDKFFVQGIHVPGLERFEIKHHSKTSTHVEMFCKFASCNFDEGQVIGVNTGFKSSKDVLLPKPHSKFFALDDYIVLQLALLIRTVILVLLILFLLQKNIPVKLFPALAHTPRAPPQ